MQQIKNFILKFALPLVLGVAVTVGYISVSGGVSPCDCGERLAKLEQTVKQTIKRVKNIEKTVVVKKKDAADKKADSAKVAPAPTAK